MDANHPVVGETYRHIKGNLYKVLHLGRHSETQEAVVVYQRVQESGIPVFEANEVWVRPLDGEGGWNTPKGDKPRFKKI